MLMQTKQSTTSNTKKNNSSSSRKRPRSTSTAAGGSKNSSFVACPAGCGRHLPNLEYKINHHLDKECTSILCTPPPPPANAATTLAPREESLALLPKHNNSNGETSTCGSKSNLSDGPTTSCHNHMDCVVEENASSQNQKQSEEIINETSTFSMQCEQEEEENEIVQSAPTQPPSIINGRLAPDEQCAPTMPSLSDYQHSLKKDLALLAALDHDNTCTEGTAKEIGSDNGGGCGGVVAAASAPSDQDQDSGDASKASAVTPDTRALKSQTTTTKKVVTANPYHAPTKPEPSSTPQSNVFAHMMQRSNRVFLQHGDHSNKKKPSKQPTPDLEQHFALEYDAQHDAFAWQLQPMELLGAEESLWQEPPHWKATVIVKDKVASKTIALTLSVRVIREKINGITNPYQQQQQHHHHRWVQHPSRLSVPVLKSMLQKSIRRRRPLPSVRVAMELIDKAALGDLLRRLIVIILEDSTLHPDLPLVVWSMMAHSKHLFGTPENETAEAVTPARIALRQALQVRTLRIIYQVASCPYQDHGNSSSGKGGDVNSISQPSLSGPFLNLPPTDQAPSKDITDATTTEDEPQSAQQQIRRRQEQLQLCIWAMLVRAAYGGMACDVQMLQKYAQDWHSRLLYPQQYPLPAQFQNIVGDWSSLPCHVHAMGKEQSLIRIPSASVVLDRLCLADVCKEGIDFHCSNLVEHLCKDISVLTALRECQTNTTMTATPTMTAADDDPQQLLKHCIWRYSAGVNLRRPLISRDEKLVPRDTIIFDEAAWKALWQDIVSPLVAAYQTKYLQERLR